VIAISAAGVATRYDPQYFHADPIAAKRSIFGEVIASGIHSAAI
jgi:acyl dehydratase